MSKVFKNEMNWSTYQDRQLSVLVSLERTFQSSLNMSKSISDNLTKVQSSMTAMVRSANSLADYVNNLSHSSRSGGMRTSNAKAAREAAEQMKRQLEEAHRLEMQQAHDLHEQNMAYLEDQVRLAREELEITRRNQRTEQEMLEQRRKISNFFWQQAQTNIEKIGKIADNYAQTSNNLIKITGVSGAAVQATRTTIVHDIIGELNKQTNGYFSPLDSYQKMVSVASEANIGSTEALKELTRPILLADASMDANIGELASMFNRFYTRYTFSSESMEEIVDDIRGNTSGNSATAEATVKNLNQLQNWISLSSRGDTEKMEAMMKSISTYTSHLESMGVNTEELTGYMNSILWGDANVDSSGLVKILAAAGSSTMDARQLLMNDPDGYAKVSELLYTGIEKVIEQYGGIDNPVMGITWDNAKIDRELLDLYTAMSSTNWKSQGDFIETIDSTKTAVETIEDKYVSATDQINHTLENIAESAASIQEKIDSTFGFGIGATEVAGAIVIAKSFFDTFSGLFGGRGSATTTSSTTSTRMLSGMRSTGINSALRGAMTTPSSMQGAAQGLGHIAGLGGGLGGAAMLAAGGAAGAGLAIDGISDMFSDDYGTTGKVLSGVEAAGGLGGAAALIGLGVTNPIGWVALAVGGIALFAKEAHKAATTFGEAKAVEKAYEKAAKSVRDKANQNEMILLEVKSTLMHTKDADAARKKLIDSGLLSESDILKARDAEKDSLLQLTDTYLKANEKWSAATQLDLNNRMLSDKEYATQLKGDLTTILKHGTVAGYTDDQAEAIEKMMFSLYTSLSDRAASGEEFNKPTRKIYEKMEKAFQDGSMSKGEIVNIVDSGFFGTHFKNANFSPEALVKAVQVLGATNSAGESMYEVMMKNLEGMSYSGDTSYDDFKGPGYAVGTNYIDRDHIALLHEGEAVVPKAYNPAANRTELEALREQARTQKSRESEETNQYMQSFVDTLTDIRQFLQEWREDNIHRETINSAKSKYSAANSYVSRYLSME